MGIDEVEVHDCDENQEMVIFKYDAKSVQAKVK